MGGERLPLICPLAGLSLCLGAMCESGIYPNCIYNVSSWRHDSRKVEMNMWKNSEGSMGRHGKVEFVLKLYFKSEDFL